MKTMLITGGASGFGKGIAIHCLKNRERVVVVGSSAANGGAFLDEAKQLGAEERAVFIQADLSLAKETRRVAEEVKERFSALDSLIFCAARHRQSYTETMEGLEDTFALDYLSRFILSYGLKECLEKADVPVIVNVCGTGRKGDVNWDDLQHKNSFAAQIVMMRGSRLNDLSGSAFAQNDTVGKIQYILYNPMAVRTPGMMSVSGTLMKLMYRIIGKPVEKAILPVIDLLNNPPMLALSAYKERKALSLASPAYDKKNAAKLFDITVKLLETL